MGKRRRREYRRDGAKRVAKRAVAKVKVHRTVGRGQPYVYGLKTGALTTTKTGDRAGADLVDGLWDRWGWN